MVHGILQFTPSIAFRYVLHRCESRDIRCRESFLRMYRKEASSLVRSCSLARVAPWFVCSHRTGRWGETAKRPNLPPVVKRVRGLLCYGAGFDNDPSAGSPTETLLRLLLPLNDKVQWTSRDVAGSEPPASPRSEHFTGPFNR